MARPLSKLTRTLLLQLRDIGEVVGASSRYWGKAGLGRLAYDLSAELDETIARSRIQRSLQRLRAQGWVAGQHHRIQLTPDGQQLVQRIEIEELTLKRPAEWDGIWRLVIWDIPEPQRRLRNFVRRTLARLGFIRIQQSVWVTPLPCEAAIATVRAELGITLGLLYIEAQRIEGEHLLRQHFKVGEYAIPRKHP